MAPWHLKEIKEMRIFRQINIKAEKLQDISEEDAQKEGVEFYCEIDGITTEAFKECIIDILRPGMGHKSRGYGSMNLRGVRNK